ncbi:MAG: M23 family metallopeptidase [Bacteroidetes bacterium]|nr:M23 family metallopeptidase [Bacteroidota bacterium]
MKEDLSDKSKKILNKLKRQHVLVIEDEEHNSGKVLFYKSRLISLIGMGILVFAAIFVLSFLSIAYTPLQKLVPGFLTSSQEDVIMQDAHMVDEIEDQIKGKEIYYSHLDSLIEEWIPEEDPNKQNAAAAQIPVLQAADEQMKAIRNFHFFSPLSGYISKQFNYQEKHYGIDIVTNKNEAVKATLNGRVIFSSWSAETGNTIVLQHTNNLISVYKHNAALLKKEGQFAKAGEVIGIIGDSGEESSGPHLHFELWFNGTPLNPSNYMNF